MAEAEAGRSDGIEAVAILTPNNTHVAIATAFLARGIHVICDKPLATSLADARALRERIRRSGRIFALTHNYSGYPMVREAHDRIAAGALGEVRLIQVEHASGNATAALEHEGNKQLAWRTDPAVAGPSMVLGDLGVHAHHLARFVTGLEVTGVSAELTTFVPGRRIDDNAHVKLRLDGGVRGLLWASMVAAGNRQGLRIRVFGTKAGLEWVQEEPDTLWIRPVDGPHLLLRKGEPWLGAAALRAGRFKAGQPEGFPEAFANIYNDVAEAIRAAAAGVQPDPLAMTYPSVDDGVRGLAFIEAAVESSRQDGAWVDVAPLDD